MKIQTHTDPSNLGSGATQDDVESFNSFFARAVKKEYPNATIEPGEILIGGPGFSVVSPASNQDGHDEILESLQSLSERVFSEGEFWTEA